LFAKYHHLGNYVTHRLTIGIDLLGAELGPIAHRQNGQHFLLFGVQQHEPPPDRIKCAKDIDIFLEESVRISNNTINNLEREYVAIVVIVCYGSLFFQRSDLVM